MGKRVDLNKRRFGKLIVVKFSHTQNHNIHWECLCDCTNICVVSSKNLLSGGNYFLWVCKKRNVITKKQ